MEDTKPLVVRSNDTDCNKLHGHGDNINKKENVPWSAELYSILKLGWPNSVSFISSLLPGMLMLVFLGRLEDGEELIAAGGMGFMFGNVTGFSIIIGLCACFVV